MARRTYLIIYIIIAVLLVLSLVVFFILKSREKFSINDVSLEILTSKEAEAGEPMNFVFICKNKSKKDLVNAKLIVDRSPGIFDAKTNAPLASSFNLDNVTAGKESRKEFQLALFGKKDEIKEIKVKIEFTPENQGESYSMEGHSQIAISEVPLFLRFDMPTQAASGQEIGFSFEYTSKSQYNFPNFAARITYAPGFQFFNADPIPKEDNDFWVFGDLKSKSEGKVSIRGSIAGIKEENKQFKTELGIIENNKFLSIFEEWGVFKIIAPLLSVEQTINNRSEYTAGIAELLKFSIKYKNNTNEKLREAFINVNLDCKNSQNQSVECLDWKELNVVNGEFNGFSKTISWRASGVPQLQELSPGEEGEVKFSILVNDKLPIKSEADKNFYIESRAKIDINPQYIPESLRGFKMESESVLAVKINSWLTLTSKGYYNHPTIKNSGPIPPKVGETTTYTIVWDVENLSNDLKEVTVEGNLPANVIWKNKIYPEDSGVEFQSYTGKVVWKIGRVYANSGTILPKKEAAFQVAIQPTQDLIKKSVSLLENITAEGIDTFAGIQLKAKNQKVTTDIPDDIIVEGQGKVVP